MLDDAPGPVRQWASTSERHGDDVPTTPQYDHDDRSVVSSYGSPVTERSRTVGVEGASYPKVVQGQHEIVRANIHVTHLWLQSLLLEQVDVIVQGGVVGSSSSAAAAGAEEVSASLRANWAEREDICRQMLHLLHSIPYVYLEPNGLYLVRSLLLAISEPWETQPFLTDLPHSGIQGPRRGRDAAQLPLRSPHAPRAPGGRVHARFYTRPVPPRPQRDRQHQQSAELGRR